MVSIGATRARLFVSVVFFLVTWLPSFSQVRLRVGDRVQVRNWDYQPWKKGTVKELVEGRIEVQRDEGWSDSWEQALPLVGAQ